MGCVELLVCAIAISLAQGAIVHKHLSSSGLVLDGEENIKENIWGTDAVKPTTPSSGVLGKMVWAQSERSIPESAAWKSRYLPVEADFQGHICGNNSRYIVTNFTLGCNFFGLHSVYAAGVGGSRSRTSGEISVEGIEDILDEVMDGETYSPWMDNHLAIYMYDIESLISMFRADGQKFVVLSWDADDMTFYSVIAHVAKTQEIYEFISPQKPLGVKTIVRFPTARHYFGGKFESLESDSRLAALHVSQTTRDLTNTVKFFQEMLGLDPISEGTFDGGRYAIFNMSTNDSTSEMHMHNGQVQLWERDDAKSGLHSPAWFEEYVENATFSSYTTSLTTCWNVWADNHFTFNGVPQSYFYEVLARYKELDYPYKEFQVPVDTSNVDGEKVLFSSYFMLPGGRWIELHPDGDGTRATEGSELWDRDYCYDQSCQ
jgi:catechol 2,3-dioxygenase-like lactoylglutathione lyase family enzyme